MQCGFFPGNSVNIRGTIRELRHVKLVANVDRVDEIGRGVSKCIASTTRDVDLINLLLTGGQTCRSALHVFPGESCLLIRSGSANRL